jgi:ABC-type sugar transport system substrate-binding protein
MADTIRGSGLRRALYALPCLAALGLPVASQCDGAIHFVLKNPGTDYFVQMHNEEVAEIFLEKLIAAIRGGEALEASETTAAKPAE